MIKLSFITDEATQSFTEAIHLAKLCGMDGIELRSVNDMPIEQVENSILREWKARLDAEGLVVCNLAGSFYKCEPKEELLENELLKLSKLCNVADILGCDTIRGFTFFSSGNEYLSGEKLAGYFEKPAKLLRERGKKLLLEADPSVNTTNHQAIANLLALLDKDVFGAIYDPGNDLYDPLREIPFPDGYSVVKPYFSHLHIKDVVMKQGQPFCVKPGTGLVDYPKLLKTLVEDGYQGWLSLEPHYRKDIVLTEEQMRVPQGTEFSRGGIEALMESAEAVKQMLGKIQKIEK